MVTTKPHCLDLRTDVSSQWRSMQSSQICDCPQSSVKNRTISCTCRGNFIFERLIIRLQREPEFLLLQLARLDITPNQYNMPRVCLTGHFGMLCSSVRQRSTQQHLTSKLTSSESIGYSMHGEYSSRLCGRRLRDRWNTGNLSRAAAYQKSLCSRLPSRES